MEDTGNQVGSRTNKGDVVIDGKVYNDVYDGMIGISRKFANINRLITRDLQNNTTQPTFTLYTKDDITTYLSNPYRYEKQLRDAITYIYGASPHFRRLIQYFVGLTDFAYIVSPLKIDPNTANPKTINRNYRKVNNLLASMNIKSQFPKILRVCLKEDTFYGTLWVTNDNVIIQQLPSAYCTVQTIENNVLNVTFDFSYFDSRTNMLEYYPAEFKTKYAQYQKNRTNKWIELDSPTSFAIKVNDEILDYSMPPFAGILREVYDLEDYRQLKLSKTILENYAMLFMKLPLDKDGNWGIDYDKAKDFWRNLDSVTPEEVGTVLTPMDIEKISFERSNTSDTDTIADAEQNLFTAAGVSSLLFNNPKASANALSLSIKVDQMITFNIVKNIEDAINRFLQSQSYGKNFKLTFLNCSVFNQKELGDAYLKAASFGLPTISAYAATQGISQLELDNMSFMETKVLELHKLFKPLQSSSQMSSESIDAASDDGGRPTKDSEDLTDSGEQSQEDKDDWG